MSTSPSLRRRFCSRDQPCAGGLSCVGRPALGQQVGRCVDPDATAWRLVEWVDEGRGSIPDAQAGGTGAGVSVFGLAPVVERIDLHLDVVHPRPGDLHFELESPEGDLIPIDRDPTANGPTYGATVQLTDVPAIASANGPWTLHFIDDVRGESGEYVGWRARWQTRWPTGLETVARLERVTALPDLYHLSESDRRWGVVRIQDQPTAPTAATVKSVIAGVYQPRPEEATLAERAVEEADVDDFFDRYTEPQPWWDESMYALVIPYRQLRTILTEELIDVRLFRIGERLSPTGPLLGAIDLFIVGVTRDGQVVGVFTVSVET